jgi:hypothetical protein
LRVADATRRACEATGLHRDAAVARPAVTLGFDIHGFKERLADAGAPSAADEILHCKTR